MDPIKGLHHVTAVTRDAQRNVNFYRNILGQRFVKKTVNFDVPDTYHLYFADEVGTPGSVLTFFAWPNMKRRGTSPTARGWSALKRRRCSSSASCAVTVARRCSASHRRASTSS